MYNTCTYRHMHLRVHICTVTVYVCVHMYTSNTCNITCYFQYMHICTGRITDVRGPGTRAAGLLAPRCRLPHRHDLTHALGDSHTLGRDATTTQALLPARHSAVRVCEELSRRRLCVHTLGESHELTRRADLIWEFAPEDILGYVGI